MTYYIYLISIGSAKYVGSTKNYRVRMSKHLKDLEKGIHSNDKLLAEYRKGHKFKSKILVKFNTMFKRQVLLKEQRYINRYSNSNEGIASNYTHYTKGEFFMDLTDFVRNNWRILVMVLFVILIVGFGMSSEQAMAFINQVISFYQSLGG